MEIAAGVHQIEGTLMGNAFLLVGEGLILVDTGLTGSLPAITHYLQRLGYTLDDLDMVVLTHHHLDHTGAVAQLYAQNGVMVAAHEADVPYLDGTLPPPGPLGRSVGGVVLGIGQRLFRMAPVPVGLPLRDGSQLPKSPEIRVIHTPGHTPGSISLYLPDRRALIVGDVVAHKWGRLVPPGWEWTVDMVENRRSLERLAGLQPEVVGFGHGPAITQGAEQVFRRFLSGWSI